MVLYSTVPFYQDSDVSNNQGLTGALIMKSVYNLMMIDEESSYDDHIEATIEKNGVLINI